MKKKKKKNSEQSITAPATTQMGPIPIWLRYSPLVVAALVLLVYWRVTGYEFLNLDDIAIIKTKLAMFSDWANLKLAFSTDATFSPVGSFYRPLQTISFMFDAHKGGAAPTSFHVTNLLLFASGCVSIFWLLRTMGYKHLPTFLLTLVYSLHPLFVLTVAWVPSRGDIFLTIFSVLSLALFIRAWHTSSPLYLILHAIAFFLAFLSKETAIVVPVACAAYYFLVLKKEAPLSTLLRYATVWLGVSLLWYALHSMLDTGTTQELVGLKSFFANIQTIPETFGKFFVPYNLKFIPLFNATDTIIGAVVFAALLAVLALTKNLTNPRVLFGLFWFLLFITPVMMYRKVDASYMFEYLYHRSFVASIGLLVIVAECINALFESKRRLVYSVAFGLAAIGCAAMSYSDLSYFKDELTFFSEAAVRTPNSLMPLIHVAKLQQDRGNVQGALANYSKAIEIQDSYLPAHINRGTLYYERNNLKEAMKDFDRVIQLDSSRADAFSSRCAVRIGLGQYAEAMTDINAALRLNPGYGEALKNRGVVKNCLKQYREAIDDFNAAILISDQNPGAFLGRGISKFYIQDNAGACADWSKAASMGSKDAQTYQQRFCK